MRRIYFGTVVVTCLLFSACAAPPERSSGAASTETTLPSDAGKGSGAARAATDESSRSAALTVGPAPEKLVGMSSDEITALFGRPVFVRRDPPGEFWRYRSNNCVLELFLYRHSGDWRVDHMEMRQGNGPVADKTACVTALRTLPRGT